jgi:hypothetical protein
MADKLKDQLLTLIQANLRLIEASVKMNEENKILKKKLQDANARTLRAIEDKNKVLSKVSPSMN